MRSIQSITIIWRSLLKTTQVQYIFRAGSFTPNDLSFVVENWSLLVGKLEDSLDPSLFQTDSHEDGTFSTLAKFVESLVGFVAFGKVLRNIAALSWLNHLLLKDIF